MTDKKLIIDMSSDICSYPFDWDNISYLYAGAQKNLGIPGVTVCIFEKDFVEENNLNKLFRTFRIILIKIQHSIHLQHFQFM